MVKQEKKETLVDSYEREMRRFDNAPLLAGLLIWLVELFLVLHYLRED